MNHPDHLNNPEGNQVSSFSNNDDDKHLPSVQVAEPSLSSSSRVSTPINMATAVHDKSQLPEHAQLPEPEPERHSKDESQTVRTDTENGSRTDGEGNGASLDRPPPAEQMGKKKIVVIMIALCLALFLAALDMTIVSTALPIMAAYFNASESGYSWMASSYLLANAACIPLWGKLSDIFGRKYMILLSNFTFLVGSLICALSVNLAMMLIGRAIQGIGGGGIVVLTNISVSDLFSVRQRPVYFGIFGAIWAIAGALGPIIGGAFTTSVTWRWCFYLNLPVGGVSFLALLFFFQVESPKTPLLTGLKSIDWVGVLFIIGGTLMFLFGLEFGGVTFPWASPTVICLIVFGVVSWVLGIVNEWKFAKYPVIPLRLFSNLHNVLLFAINCCHAFSFIASTYYLPLYFQTVLQATPVLSGVYILPYCLSLSITSIFTGWIIKATGRYRELIAGGLVFMALGFGLFINLQPYPSWPRIIIYQIIAGIGVGPVFQSPLVGLQATVHQGDAATATAAFNFFRQTSAAMAIVLGTVIYQNVLQQQGPSLARKVGPQIAQKVSSSFSGSQKSLISALNPSQRSAVLQTFTFSLSRLWIFYTCFAVFAVLLSFLIRPVTLSTKHTVAKTGLEEQERARQEILAIKREKKGEV